MTDLQFTVSALDRATAALLKVAAQLDRVGDKLDKLDGKVARIAVKLEGEDRAVAALDNVERKVKRLDGQKAKIKVDVDKSLSDSLVKLNMVGKALRAFALPAAIVTATPYVAALGAAAVQTSGALLLLPAAGLAVAGMAGTLAVGFTHVNDALGPTGTPAQLKKVNEALAKLSPNARAAVESIRGLGPAWSGVRLDVQDKLFAGLSDKIKQLGGTYLPVLKTGLGGTATELNRSASGFADWAKSTTTVRQVSTVLDQTRLAVHALAPAVTNVSAGLLDMGTVGSKYLPLLATHFTNLTQRFRDWVTQAKESGKLDEWIQTGILKVQQLGSIVGNVGSVLMSVFRAGAASGADFLGTVDRITAGIANFLKSGEGQGALVALFKEIRATVDALEPGVAAVASALAAVITEASRAGVLHDTAAALSAIAISVMPLAKTLLDLAVMILPPVVNLIGAIAPVLGPVVAGFLAWSLASKGLSAVQGVLTTMSTKLADVALNAGVTTEKLTGSANAGERVATAGDKVSGALTKVGSALPIIGIGLVAIGLAYDEFGGKADQAASKVLDGSLSMQAAIQQEGDQIHRNQIEWLGGMNAQESYAAAARNVTAEIDKQRASMSPMQQLQSDVARAQADLNNAIAQFGANSPQAVSAADALRSAHQQLDTVTQGAATAEQTLGEKIQGTQQIMAGAANANIGYQQSLLTLKSAQTDYTTAVAEHGVKSDEAAAADLRLQSAHLAAAEAARQKAIKEAEAAGITDTATIGAQAYREELLRQAETMTGPSKQALIDLANGTGNAGNAADVARLQSEGYKSELDQLGKQADGPTKAAIDAAKRKLDEIATSHSTADQKARDQKQTLEDLRSQVDSKTVPAIQSMIDHLGNIPKVTTFTVHGIGDVSYGSPELLRAAHGGYTGGIIGMNRAGLTGIAYADGGVTPGYTPGRDVHRFRSATGGTLDLSGGEAIMRPEFTRAVGPTFVHGANSAARSGGTAGVRRYMGFADGGILPYQRFADGGIQLTGTSFPAIPGQIFNTVAGSLVGTIRSAIDTAINKLIEMAKAIAAAAAAAAASIGGGIGVALGGGGGARSWIIAHESGGNPRAQNPTSSASGLYQFIDGTWRGLGGSTAHAKDASVAEQNAIADRYVSSRYGSWEGAKAFWISHGWYDRGGMLQPGMTMAMNTTGTPERILSPSQTRAYDQMPTGRGGNDALLTELRQLNGTTRMLRGDVDQGGYFAELIGQVRALRAELASSGRSVTGEASGARYAAALGAF